MGETGWWRAAWRRVRPPREAEPAQLAEQLSARLQVLAQERDEAVQAAAQARERAEAAETELYRLQGLVADQPVPGIGPKRDLPEPGPVTASPPTGLDDLDELPWIAKELVVITDRLTDILHADPIKDPQRATTVIQWAGEVIHDLLARCGVVTIDEDGLVDPRRHEVIGVCPAPAPELTDHIAETVQPGYEWRGTLIRTQRVVAYAEPVPD
jgi:hypothetical protein